MKEAQRAYEKIRTRLATGSWKVGQKLPSLSKLAELCAVSRSTMWKALGQLKADSLVSTKRGGAIVAGTSIVAALNGLPESYAWERVKEQIGKDARLSNFPAGKLPPISKLAVQYRASLETIRKALKGLELDRILVRQGRSWLARQNRSNQGQRSVVLLSWGNKETGIFQDGERIRELVDHFERECPRLGFRSHCIGFDDHSPTSLIELMSELKDLSGFAGAIVSPWNTWEASCWQRWLDVLDVLSRRGVPVIAVDQMGDLSFPDTLRRSANFKVLRIAGVRAGEMVAEYLLRQGHTHIAFVAPRPDFSWVRKRYDGMTGYASRYGKPGTTIEMITPDINTNQTELTLALLNLSQNKIRTLYRDRLSESEMNDLVYRFKKLKAEKLDKSLPFDPSAKSIRDFALFLISRSAMKQHQKPYAEMVTFLMHLASTNATAFYFRPFLTKAFRTSLATAWVCADDLMSNNVFYAFRNREKRLPGDVALVGFENWRYSREHQITAYDFNMNGMAQQALLMILDEKPLKSAPAITEVDGYMVERRTTRR